MARVVAGAARHLPIVFTAARGAREHLLVMQQITLVHRYMAEPVGLRGALSQVLMEQPPVVVGGVLEQAQKVATVLVVKQEYGG